MKGSSIGLAAGRGPGRRVSGMLLSYGFYLLFVIIFLLCSILSPVFLTVDNIMQILWGATTILIASAGVTFVIITGNMDMSVGSLALCSMAVGINVGKMGAGFGGMLLAIFGTGLVVGLINGLLITCCGLNSMLCSLGMMIALRGLALNISDGGVQFSLDARFKAVANAEFLGVNLMIIVSLLVMLLLQVVLRKTRFGAYCYAIGNSELSANRVGLPVRAVKTAVYMLSGVCASVAGFISCCKLGTFSGAIGNGMEFDIVSVCVIGGTSLLGGRGNILPGTFFGVILLYLINNGLALFGASPYVYPFAKGLVIFAAMYVDALKHFQKKA